MVKDLTSELGTSRKQHTPTRVRMTILERQCKSQLEKAQTRVQQTQTSSSVPSANLELQLQPTPELLRQAIATDGLLSQTRSTGEFDDKLVPEAALGSHYLGSSWQSARGELRSHWLFGRRLKKGAPSLATLHRRMYLSKVVLSSDTAPEVLCN